MTAQGCISTIRWTMISLYFVRVSNTPKCSDLEWPGDTNDAQTFNLLLCADSPAHGHYRRIAFRRSPAIVPAAADGRGAGQRGVHPPDPRDKTDVGLQHLPSIC